MLKKFGPLVWLAVAAMAGLYGARTVHAAAQGFVSYSGGTYTQDFNTLPFTNNAPVNESGPTVTIGNATGNPTTATVFTLPAAATAFSLSDTSIGANSTPIASNADGWWAVGATGNKLGAQEGSQTTGGLVSFGGLTSSNRAIGLLATSTSGITEFGVRLKNTTASTTYNQITLSFTGELWRQSTTANVKTINFGYVVDTTGTGALPTTGLTAVAALNISFAGAAAAAAVDGTLPANQSAKGVANFAISSWAPNQVLWLTWTISNANSSGQGIGIDDLSFSAAAVANVTWNVAGSGTWDTVTGNWTGGSPVANLYKDPDNAMFNNAAGGTITVQAGGVLPGSTTVSAASGTYTFTGGSIGSGAVNKSGGGTLALSSSNAYSGGTNVTGGVLQISADNQLGAATGALSLDSFGTLSLSGAVSGTRNLAIGTGGATIATGGNNFSTSGTSAINGTLSTTGAGNVALNGATTFGATGALNIGTGGSVTFGQSSGTVSQANGGTYTGNLFVTNGIRLNFDGPTAFTGSAQINVQSSAMVCSNTSGSAGGTVNVPIMLNSGSLAFTKGDVTQATYVPGTFVTTMGGTKLTVAGDNLLTLGGVISGNSDINFANDATLGGGSGNMLLGAANTYTGASTFNMGNSAIKLGVNNALPTGTDVIFGTLASVTTPTLDLNGHSQQINSLSHGATGTPGNFKITNGGALDATLTVTGNTTPANPFGGVISDGATNKIALVKNGTSTLTLSGVCTYTTGTKVNGGTLSITGSIATGVLVNGSAAGSAIRGTGTINGTITTADATNANARVWPGIAAAVAGLSANETLTANSADLSGGGRLVAIVRHNGGAPVSQKLLLTGSFTLDSSSVLSLAYDTGTYADAFTVLKTGAPAGDLPAFNNVLPPGTAGVAYDLVYKKASAVVATNPALGSTITGGYDEIVVQFKNTAVTPVTLADFSARAEGAGVALSWNAVSEYQNAGFNVYRRAASGEWGVGSGEWQRVNSTLIAGRITNPDLKVYRLYDWAAPGVYEYRLESVSLRGVKEDCRDTARVVVDGLVLNGMSPDSEVAAERASEAVRHWLGTASGTRTAMKLTAEDTGKVAPPAFRKQWYSKIFGSPVLVQGCDIPISTLLASVRQVADARFLDGPENRPTSSAASAAAAARWFSAASARSGSSFSGAKVVYGDSGVLLIPQAMLPAGFDFRHVTIQREGRALSALALTADGLLVYGPGYQDDYTNKDAIFLRNSAAPTVAGAALQAQGLFDSERVANASAPASVTAAYHDVYFDYAYRPFNFAPWFSNQYLTDGSDQTFTISTPHAINGAASLTVNLWSVTQAGAPNIDGGLAAAAPDHALSLKINGQPAGVALWTGGDTMMQLAFQLPAGVLNDGANQIELVTPELGGTQLSFVHSMTVSYTRALDCSTPLALVNASGTPKLYEVSRVPSSSVWVVDARFPDRAALAPYQAQLQADGTYTVRFIASGSGTGKFLVVPAGQENRPVSVNKCSVKPVKAVPYLAVGPSQFASGIQPLLTLRSKEGLRAAFVDQEQLFDYYNYGRYGPAGIRNAVRAARPQYLLLLGRTTYDYNNYSGANVDPLCPTFLVPTTFWAQATSDSMFGDLGRGYPEVAVGRLPVNNADELNVAVRRVIAYSGAPGSNIRVNATTDQADPDAGDFAAEADTISQLNPDMTWQRNYLGVTVQSAPEVTSAMADAANGGADWIVYVGHGNAVRLGNEVPRILNTDMVQAWTGNVVFLQSTCTGNWMAKDEQDYKSIAIQALTQPQGGIAASIGTSTYMNSKYAAEFMGQLMSAAGSGGRWGNALMKTQAWAAQRGGESGFYLDLSNTEQIFGDPAMPVYAKPAANAAGTKQGQF